MLSPPPGLSQSATSFIASCCQGIHQTPFSRLIRSRRRRALLLRSWFNRNPLLLWTEVDLTRWPRDRSRAIGGGRSIGRLLGQCHRLGKTVFGVLPRFALLEDERPRIPPNAGRARSPTRERTQKRLVFRSLHDVSCRMSPSGRSVVVSLARSDRKAHPAMSLPIGSRGGLVGPAGSRTGDLTLAKRALYPAELRPRRGGAYRDRTGDLMLAKHALSQLS